ncbi:GntP family permease [Leeuwenhoekiella sp. A16]|uniref:GntP family permease n=1 Tax=Leeuwenhoekiella sp. A16 TaxID=3141462 RepID=UPI003A7F6CFE
MLTGYPLLLVIALSIVLIILLTSKWKLHPFLALIVACFFVGFATGMPLGTLVTAIEDGFGGLMRYIGIIVIFGSVIGVFLEKSGGAMRIAHKIIALTGEGKIIPAISLIGAVVSVPVFCDSGFILLSGLADKLSQLGKANKASLSLALATGLYTTHTLIPPTPGPIAAAGNIGASGYLGTIIITGLCFAIPILIITWFFSKRLGKNITAEEVIPDEPAEPENQVLPSFTKAIFPVVLPIILIAIGTILNFAGIENEILDFISNPLVAIFLGAITAMLLLKPKTGSQSSKWFVEAIKVSGPILIITGAGGAFGGVLKATPLKDFIAQWMSGGNSGDLLILASIFLIAAVLKTAQGSSTSAMVITSSLLASIIPTLGWDQPLQFALAVMAIGGGAMTVSHFNDSYFWVVSQFSGMSAKDTNRSFSLMTGIQGLTVLVLCVLSWVIFV